MKYKLFYLLTSFFILIYLFLYSNESSSAILEGLQLWGNSVLPTLFPFFVINNFLFMINITDILSPYFSFFIKALFNMNSNASYPFILSLLCGYPMGAKAVCDCYTDKKINKNEAQVLLNICSTPGPVFIIGTVSVSFLNNINIGIIILSSIYLGSLILSILYSKYSLKNNKKNTHHHKHNNEYLPFSIAFTLSIIKGTKSIIDVGAYIVFFSLLISFFSKIVINPLFNIINISFVFKTTFQGLIYGIFEMSNGIKAIANISSLPLDLKTSIITFILSSGGFCVNTQCMSFISKTDLSFKKYFKIKIIQGIICFNIAYIMSKLFLKQTTPCFNLYLNYNRISYISTTIICLLLLFIIYLCKTLNKN